MNAEKGQVSVSRQSGRKRHKTSNQDEPALVHRSNTDNHQSRSASPFVKKQNQSIAFTTDTESNNKQQQAQEGDQDSDPTADQVTTLIQTDLPSIPTSNPRYATRSNKASNPPTPTVKNHLLNQRVSQSPTRSHSPRERSNQKANRPEMSRAGHSFTLEIDQRESPSKESGGKGKGKEKEKETEKESNGEDAVLQGNGNGVEEEQQLIDEENQDGEDREKPETEQERKERETDENLLQSWKEEFFEIVEQLPLELHRSFALMRELEQQMHGRLKAISDSSKSYREARGFLNPEPNPAETQTSQPEASTSASTLQIPETSQPDSQEVIASSNPPSSSSSFQTAESSSHINNPPLPQVPSFKPSQSYSNRRSILKQIAESSNEAIRSAEEKVGLAATAYDWVDRHIRRLDSDLLKSENSLTMGLRPGTKESNNASNSNGLGKSSNGDLEMRNGNLEGLMNDDDGEGGGGGENKKKRKRPIPKNKNRGSIGNDDRDDLSILPDMPIDPNEPRYCYCDQVSFGDMVACENDDCPREWFHYHCVDLASQPKGKWWCQFCAPKGWRGVGTAIPPGAPYVPAR